MEKEKAIADKENSKNECNARYSLSEDMAIVNYMIDDNKYLKSSGVEVWKNAEKLGICPGRSYLSMKERFRKVIVKNLKQYNVEKQTAVKVTQFMRANQKGEMDVNGVMGFVTKTKTLLRNLIILKVN